MIMLVGEDTVTDTQAEVQSRNVCQVCSALDQQHQSPTGPQRSRLELPRCRTGLKARGNEVWWGTKPSVS